MPENEIKTIELSNKALMSSQHRVIFTNTFHLAISNNEVAIGMCVDGGLIGYPQGTPVHEVSVIMTHTTTKILAHLLRSVIEKYEAENGPINVPLDKLQQIDQSVTAAREQAIQKSENQESSGKSA